LLQTAVSASTVTAWLCNHMNVAQVSRPAVVRASSPALVHDSLPNHVVTTLVIDLNAVELRVIDNIG
jgi:hypothetical protein